LPPFEGCLVTPFYTKVSFWVIFLFNLFVALHYTIYHSKLKKAKEAIQRYSILPGFIDYKDGFIIEIKRVYVSNEEAIKTIYSVEHEYTIEDNIDIVTRLSYHSDEAQAADAVKAYKCQAEFKEYPDCFIIYHDDLDKDSEFWVEGFTID